MTTTPAPSIAASPLTGTSTGPFPTGFKYDAAENVRVYLELAGVRQPDLTPVTDYTLTGATPKIDGGTVTLSGSLVPVAGWDEDAGDRVVIRRRTIKSQALALPDSEGHKPRATEAALDKQMRTLEEVADGLDLTIGVPVGEPGITLLPDALRDGKLPVFAGGGIGFLDTPERLIATNGEGKAYTLEIVRVLQEIGVDIYDEGFWSESSEFIDEGVFG